MKKIILVIIICSMMIISIGCESKKEIETDNLKDTYNKIDKYFGNENVDRDNLAAFYLDKDVVVVELINNSEYNQKEFIKNANINSKYVKFKKGGPYTTSDIDNKKISFNDYYKDKETDLLKKHGNVILTISSGNKSCIPVKLVLYDDSKYELFTSFESCRQGEACNDVLKYTKSIKGKYDYDAIKIIEEDNIEINKSHSMDNLPKYEIYVGDKYVKKGYEYNYSVEKGTTNKSLEELLSQINLNLFVCAKAEYTD